MSNLAYLFNFQKYIIVILILQISTNVTLATEVVTLTQLAPTTLEATIAAVTMDFQEMAQIVET